MCVLPSVVHVWVCVCTCINLVGIHLRGLYKVNHIILWLWLGFCWGITVQHIQMTFKVFKIELFLTEKLHERHWYEGRVSRLSVSFDGLKHEETFVQKEVQTAAADSAFQLFCFQVQAAHNEHLLRLWGVWVNNQWMKRYGLINNQSMLVVILSIRNMSFDFD